MKLYRTLAIFTVLCPSAFSATATPYKGVLETELHQTRPQPYTDAQVSVNADAKTLDINLFPKAPDCLPGKACITMMPEPEAFAFSDLQFHVDSCGVVHTEAKYDQTPVDGPLIKVHLADNRNNSCPTVAVLPPTQLTFETTHFETPSGKPEHNVYSFSGSELKPVLAPEAPEFQGKISKAFYQGKKLELTLEYSGGCKEHAFDLKWGDCKSTKLLNTTLKECKVTLLHTAGSDDMCEAYITKKHVIDMSDLGATYIIDLKGTRILVH